MAEIVKAAPGCLSLMARKHGLEGRRALESAVENRDLVDWRRNPNILGPDDSVAVPQVETKTISRAVDQRHEFVVRRERISLLIRILDEVFEPVANRPWTLRAGAAFTRGETDANGVLNATLLSDATAATLCIEAAEGDRLVWTLDIGGLAPLTTDAGLAQRLQNLGYGDGLARSETAMARARAAFRRDLGVEPAEGPLEMGEIAHLEGRHGC
jgi:hypothetical protein